MFNFLEDIDMHIQDSIPTLDYVINQVNAWREQKKHRSELMPESLKVLIARLAPLHSAYKIASSLKISLSTFCSFKNTYYSDSTASKKAEDTARVHDQLNKQSEDKKMNFIPFQLLPLSSSDNTINLASDASATCQIIKPDGTKLVITTNNPNIIIQSFLCYN